LALALIAPLLHRQVDSSALLRPAPPGRNKSFPNSSTNGQDSPQSPAQTDHGLLQRRRIRFRRWQAYQELACSNLSNSARLSWSAFVDDVHGRELWAIALKDTIDRIFFEEFD
jgi:hypothetical protein